VSFTGRSKFKGNLTERELLGLNLVERRGKAVYYILKEK